MFSAVLLGMTLGLGAPAGGAPVLPPAVTAAPSSRLPTPQFRRYGIADGLPSSAVYAVVQDRNGAMWFATKGGIARYDGVDFTVFRHVADDPDSLYDNGIASLLFDRDGRLWAGGLEAGLNRYDAASGKFTHWQHDPHDPASLSSDKVWTIAQDVDGSLLVGTVRGLDRLLPDGHGFAHVANPLLGPDPAAFGLVAALYVDAQRQLWIGSSRGLFRRDADGHMHKVSQLDSSVPIDAWHIDGEGDEVRIASTRGLLLVGKDDIARPFGGGVIPSGNVLSSVRDAAGRLWVGAQQGLFLQRWPGGPMMSVTDQPVLRGDLPGTWVWSMLVDHEGGLWVGLLDGGVAYLAPGWNDTSRFTHIPDDPASLRDSIVTAMARGHDGRVWVGERGGRVDKLDPLTGKVDHVLSDLGGDVLGMTQDAHDRLWIAVRGGLYRYESGKPPVRVDPSHRWLKHPLEVELGPDERMYARTFGEGLFRVDQETLVVSRVPMEQTNQRVLWGSQLTLHDGSFWYASDGGMLRLDARHDRFEAIAGVSNDRAVNAFDFTAHGLWMVRPDGLEHYHYHGDGLLLDRTVGAAQGWPSINVVDVRVDARQRVWLLGHDGLWCFDPVQGRFRSFGLQDGLANSEFSRGFALMPDGNMYAPTLGGVVGFDPDRIRERSGRPPLAITRVSVRRHGKLQPLPADQTSIELGWRERGFDVTARLFSYVDPAANRYRFKLRGFDSDWVDTGNHGEREFAGLGAGNYRLDVEAAGPNGQWSHLSRPLQIQVQAPPWARWWAWLGYVLLSVAAGRPDPAGLASATGAASPHAAGRAAATDGRGGERGEDAVPGHAEPRDPHADDRGDGDGRAAAEHAAESAAARLHPGHAALRRDAAEAAQRRAGPGPDRGGAAGAGAGTVRSAAAARGRGATGAGTGACQGHPLRAGAGRRPAGAADRRCGADQAGAAEPGQQRAEVHRARSREPARAAQRGRSGVQRQRYRPGHPRGEPGTVVPALRAGRRPATARRQRTGAGDLPRTGGHDGRQHRAGIAAGATAARSGCACRWPSRSRRRRCRRAPVARGSYRLLLVEDDTIVAAVIRGLLEREGHTVVHVLNGLAALAELAHARFDAVLLDLDLPGVDGFQIARLIRQREVAGEHLPIVAVTARSGSEDEARARAAGMDGFLRKPLSGEQLASALARIVGTTAPASGRSGLNYMSFLCSSKPSRWYSRQRTREPSRSAGSAATTSSTRW